MKIMSIPLIDFAVCKPDSAETIKEEAKQAIGKTLVDALSSVGFAYLKNTGITKECVEQLTQVSGLFFDCSEVEKRKFSKNTIVFGYAGVEEEKLNAKQSAGYKETFNVTGCLLDMKDGSVWPDNLSPTFSKTVRKFMERCKRLSLFLLEILALGLQLQDSHFLKQCHSLMNKTGNSTALRILCYPSLPDELGPDKVRLGEHSDYGTITLLFQDEVGGLEIQRTNGEYVSATPIEDTVLINVGDLLQVWTKGKLKSAKHRVLSPKDLGRRHMIRRSIAYFVNPDDDTRIDKPLQYKTGHLCETSSCEWQETHPITASEYISNKNSLAYQM